MNDYSYNATITKKYIDISAGKNILTSVTDQGILRIFFTDKQGYLYGSIVKRSNFKQIINDSFDTRNVMNNTNMSQQYYGAPFLTKKYRYKDTNSDTSGDLVDQEGTFIGNFNINWRHDAFLNNRRGSGDDPDTDIIWGGSGYGNNNGAKYATNGYSTGADIWYDIHANGHAKGLSGNVPAATKNTSYHFKQQRIPNTFWDCVGEGYYFDGSPPTLHNFRINSPDVYRFINDEENLIYSISGNSENLSSNDINSSPTLDYKYPHITSTSTSEIRNIEVDTNSYFQVCRRPSRRMLIQDMGGVSTFEEGNATRYPQGFILYAKDEDLFIKSLFENTIQNNEEFRNKNTDTIATVNKDSAFCDLVLDISQNVHSDFQLYQTYGPSGDKMINYNDTLSRAFFIYELQNDLTLKQQLNIGSLTPINYNTHVTITRRYDYSGELLDPPLDCSLSSYCKIKCDKNATWNNKKIHIVYKEHSGNIRYERYNISGFMEPGENTSSKNGKATSEVSHNIDCSYCGWCQLDLDNSNNPHIAFFDISDVSDISHAYPGISPWDFSGSGRINYIWNDSYGDNGKWKNKEIINNDVGIYFDLSTNSNENFLSLACSPYDGSTHISYYTELSGIQYWTNSQYTPHAIKDSSSNETVFSALAYGKKLIDNNIRNPYVDLSWNMDISNIYLPLYSIDTPYPYITNPKQKINVTHSKKNNNNNQLNANLCDIIYINTTVKTPTTFDVSKTIFLMGGDTGVEGANNGKRGAYIGGVTDNSKVYFGINGINNTLSISKELSGNKIYHLTFYYNKYDREAKITISGEIYDNSSELFSNISTNGGYNMLDGYLTVGSSSHENDTNPWTDNNAYIKRISVYNTDISNITFYDISRENSNIITNWSHTQYIDYSGHNVSNKELNTREAYSYSISGSNEYNKIQYKSSVNSYKKTIELHELFYIQRIKQQPDKEDGEEITVRSMDIYHTGSNTIEDIHKSIIWVVGGKKKITEGTTTGYILVSNNGGESWVENYRHPLYDSIIEVSTDISHNKDNAQYYSVKLFVDDDSNKWAWLSGNEYGLYYCVANNWEDLGVNKNDWKIIGDISGFGARDQREPTVTKRTLNYVYPVKYNVESTDIFGSPPSNGDFHIWVGGNHNENNHVDPSSGAFDMVLRGNKDTFNALDTLLDIGVDNIGPLLPEALYTTITGGSGVPDTYVLNLSMFPDICRNIIWTDISKQKTKNTELYNINFDNNGKYGIIGGKNNIFVTLSGGSIWESKLDSSENYVEVIGSNIDIENDSFSVVTNSVPWLGSDHIRKDFPVVSTAKFSDPSFNLSYGYPNKNGTWDPLYNKGGYWDVATLPYNIIGGISGYSNKPNNVYKTNNFIDISNNWVIGYNNNTEYTIFNKNTTTETWMRHDLNTIKDISGNIQSIVAIDNCGVLLFVGGDENSGIYKLSIEPLIPDIVIKYPMIIRDYDNKTDGFRSQIHFENLQNIDISNNIKYQLFETTGNDLSAQQAVFDPNYSIYNVNLKPDPKLGPGFYTDVSANTERIYRTNLLYPNTTYKYKARTQNEFGNSFYTDVKEFTSNIVNTKIFRNEKSSKILKNDIKWIDLSHIYFYDISRSWFWLDPSFNELSGNEISGNQILMLDVSNTNQTRFIDDINYIDFDISLNFRYIYYLTIKGPQKEVEDLITIYIDVPHGNPIATHTEYDYNSNKIKIKWQNHDIDHESTNVTYDISWAHLNNNIVVYSGLFKNISSSHPNMTDTSNSTMNNLIYEYDYSGNDLSANYVYKFQIDSSYNNMSAANALDLSGIIIKSLSSEILNQSINAVVPYGLAIEYDSPPSGNGNEIKISWEMTDNSFNEIHWMPPHDGTLKATGISYEISFNNIYHANTVRDSNINDTSYIKVFDTDSYILGDRGFSGNSITKFQVRALYPYFNSAYTDISSRRIAKHIPVFTGIQTVFNSSSTSRKDGDAVYRADKIILNWEETTGALQYDISKVAYFYNTNINDISKDMVGLIEVPAITPIDGNNINYGDDDMAPDASEDVNYPRKYKYSIKAKYL